MLTSAFTCPAVPDGSDVAEEFALVAQLGEDGTESVEDRLLPAAHQVERAGAGLRNAGRHAGFE